MRAKILALLPLFFAVFNASAMSGFLVTATEVKQTSEREPSKSIMIQNQKLEHLNERIDAMEANLSAQNNTNHLEAKMTRLMNSMEELVKIKGNVTNIETLLLRLLKIQNDPSFNASFNNPNPCPNVDICNLTGSAYHCVKCPYPISGNDCAQMKCDRNQTKCFKSADTVYVVFENKGFMTWEAANRKCVSEGLGLAMTKTKETTEFAIKQLRTLYGKENEKKALFWIGLLKVDGKWGWLDGSEVGAYTGGVDFNTGHSCGTLSLILPGRLWDDYPCHIGRKYDYYVLCEIGLHVSTL